MTEDNILERVPGPYVSDALQTLPNAETATVDRMEAVIDVPGIGTVRITARRLKSKKGKAVHYVWSAAKAVVVS
jgi:hypothetical protein